MDAVQDEAFHLHRARIGAWAVPRAPRRHAPADRDAAADEAERLLREGRRQAAGRERRGADDGGSAHRVPSRDRRDAALREAREVGQGEDLGGLRADERLPALADQVRAGA